MNEARPLWGRGVPAHRMVCCVCGDPDWQAWLDNHGALCAQCEDDLWERPEGTPDFSPRERAAIKRTRERLGVHHKRNQ